jgi:hypothetical protein
MANILEMLHGEEELEAYVTTWEWSWVEYDGENALNDDEWHNPVNKSKALKYPVGCECEMNSDTRGNCPYHLGMSCVK